MTRPTAVQFGAGSIGRGFLGQLLSEAGFEVVFIDVKPEIVTALNERQAYPLRLVSADAERRLTIAPVRAVDGRDEAAITREVERAAVISTAVGASALPHIARPLAEGLARRRSAVNLLICENLPDPAAHVRDLLLAQAPSLAEALGVRIGLVACTIGRMVPIADARSLSDPLEMVAEPYDHLPADRHAWVGEPLPIPGLELVDAFPAHVRLKLFVHNAGHAAIAYHAFPRGYVYIHEAMDDPDIRESADRAMRESCEAIRRADRLPGDMLAAYREDLLRRVRNPHLGDTVARVGRDPIRKLGVEERLIGAARFAMAAGVTPRALCRAAAAALRFNPDDDPSAGRLQRLVAERGEAGALQEVSGLAPEHPVARLTLLSTPPPPVSSEVELRAARPDEYPEVLALWGAVWGFGAYFRAYLEGDPWFREPYCRVARVDGRIVSAVHICRRPIRHGTRTLTMGGIANVATLPDYRQRGYSGALLGQCVRVMEDEGFDFSALGTGIHRHYARHGWFQVTVPHRELALAADGDLPSADPDLGPLSIEDWLSEGPPIYAAFNSGLGLCFERSLDYWEGWLRIRSAEWPSDRFIGLGLRRSGMLEGYLLGLLPDRPGDTMQVHEVAALRHDDIPLLTAGAARAGRTAHAGRLSLRLPHLPSIMSKLGEIGTIKTTENPYTMLRRFRLDEETMADVRRCYETGLSAWWSPDDF